jgi:hypothetical protein
MGGVPKVLSFISVDHVRDTYPPTCWQTTNVQVGQLGINFISGIVQLGAVPEQVLHVTVGLPTQLT